MPERLFKLSENQTSARTEVLAGATTFLTIAHIIFVQPARLPTSPRLNRLPLAWQARVGKMYSANSFGLNDPA
jgi:xanthine/uracil/vitamin C permease (AzgA family)